MAYISQITLPSGSTYKFKDEDARNAIAGLTSFDYVICSSAENTPVDVTWENGGTTITGVLAASSSTIGKIYLVPSVNGTKDIFDEYMTINTSGSVYVWEKFGNTDIDLSSLGDLAYKNSASGSITPTGSISRPTFSGDTSVFVGDYQPAGEISQPTFTGTQGSVSVSGTPNGTISVGNGTANYTPSGTVSAPTVTVTPNSITRYVATSSTGGGEVTAGTASSCTLPTLTTTVSNETLVLNWTAGSFTQGTPTAVTLPSFLTQPIVYGIASATATAPNFTGTGANLVFTGSNSTASGTFTPEGTVSTPEFTGNEAEISVSGTPQGTISVPTFTGNAQVVTVT